MIDDVERCSEGGRGVDVCCINCRERGREVEGSEDVLGVLGVFIARVGMDNRRISSEADPEPRSSSLISVYFIPARTRTAVSLNQSTL